MAWGIVGRPKGNKRTYMGKIELLSKIRKKHSLTNKLNKILFSLLFRLENALHSRPRG